MKDVIAADVDGTLMVNSRHAIGRASLLTIDTYASGASVTTPIAGRAIASLIAEDRLVPVTTRSLREYHRLAWPGGEPPRIAVAANGAEILVDGMSDRHWRDRLRTTLSGEGWDLAEAVTILDGVHPSWSVRDVDGWFAFAVAADPTQVSESIRDRLADEARTRSWTLSIQGRKVYLLPRAVTKEAALKYVEDRFARRVMCAIGDSILDRGMLAMAPRAGRPAFGELAQSVWTAPGLYVAHGNDPLESVERLILWASKCIASSPSRDVQPHADECVQSSAPPAGR